jgi:hypothetical protein
VQVSPRAPLHYSTGPGFCTTPVSNHLYRRVRHTALGDIHFRFVLTYMATIDSLVGNGELELFTVPDDHLGCLPVRPLWLGTDLITYIDGTLVYCTEEAAGRTAYEHLEQFFVDFRCNERVHADDLRRMLPTGRGIWSMHPPLLRVYGWVPRQHSMVAIHAVFESATKSDSGLNDRCRNLVMEFIKRHNVSEIIYGDFRDAFPKAA